MRIKHKLVAELKDLLVQLALFVRANETRISADQVINCIQHLSATENSALDRLFFLLHQNKVNIRFCCLICFKFIEAK
jgi:hypothetical protein